MLKKFLNLIFFIYLTKLNLKKVKKTKKIKNNTEIYKNKYYFSTKNLNQQNYNKFINFDLRKIIIKEENDLEKKFEIFITKYNKNYKTEEEKQIRFNNFKNNYDFIENENKLHNYKLEMNKFGDLTFEEFDIILKSNNIDFSNYKFKKVNKNDEEINKSKNIILLEEKENNKNYILNDLNKNILFEFYNNNISNKINSQFKMNEKKIINCLKDLNNIFDSIKNFTKSNGIWQKSDLFFNKKKENCDENIFIRVKENYFYELKYLDDLYRISLENSNFKKVQILQIKVTRKLMFYKEGIFNEELEDTDENQNSNLSVLLSEINFKENMYYNIKLKTVLGNDWGNKGSFNLMINVEKDNNFHNILKNKSFVIDF